MKKDNAGYYNIGLVMAGAVTAGAFTGGVINYLLNTLELWEQEYQRFPDATPKPNVRIETMTGASAGSIAAAVTLLSLVTKRNEEVLLDQPLDPEKSLQYYTWVDYGLENSDEIIEKIFSTNDIRNEEVKSILNTHFIDQLIEKLGKILNDSTHYKLPNYIRSDIEILMTLSNLRGVPLDLYFSNDASTAAHTMSYHKAYAYFQFNKKSSDASTLKLDLRDKESLELFLNCARASGAFPIGLRSVPFEKIPKDYIQANLQQIFGEEICLEPRIEEDYKFLAVDGGMTNNEPIAEAIKILRRKKDSDDPVIMIDPFPNYLANNEPNNDYDLKADSLKDIIPQLYHTLRNQVLFKEKDIAQLFDKDSDNKMIWPTRYNENGKALRNPIATGALGGFSGFFDKSFREHDFMLGMKNCQNFIRYYFSQDIDKAENWASASAIDKFSFTDQFGNKKIPIIPDYRITNREEATGAFLPRLREHHSFPSYPSVSQKELINDRLKPVIKKRVQSVVSSLLKKQDGKDKTKPPYITQSELSKGLLAKLIPRGIKNWFLKDQIVNATVPMILDNISRYLYEHDLFNDVFPRPDTTLDQDEDIVA